MISPVAPTVAGNSNAVARLRLIGSSTWQQRNVVIVITNASACSRSNRFSNKLFFFLLLYDERENEFGAVALTAIGRCATSRRFVVAPTRRFNGFYHSHRRPSFSPSISFSSSLLLRVSHSPPPNGFIPRAL